MRVGLGTVPSAAMIVAVVSGCAASRHLAYDDVVDPVIPAKDRAIVEDLAKDEEGLAEEARLETLVRLALARNPELVEARARIRGQVVRVASAGRLPDLEVKYEQWGVPLDRPYAVDDAEMVMFGVRQSIPASGSRSARSRVAEAEARAAGSELRARELDVVRQVKRAYYEYLLATREYVIHVAHVELTHQVLEAARASYATGKGSQEDVLRIVVEMSRLHTDLSALDQRKKSAASLLNALMGRAIDAKIGRAPDLSTSPDGVNLADLLRKAEAGRPELRAASQRVAGAEASLDVARREARWPMFMLGADYMYMPQMEDPHRYGVMISMTLPWLNPRHGEEVSAAKHDVEAERRAVEAARNVVRYEVADAVARYDAAREAYAILHRDLAPQAQQSLEAAQATFVSGGGSSVGVLDALRSVLLVRLEEMRALVRVAEAAADLDRAVGGSHE